MFFKDCIVYSIYNLLKFFDEVTQINYLSNTIVYLDIINTKSLELRHMFNGDIDYESERK